MAEKKIRETPDFVKGLLVSADAIDTLLDASKISPRVLLQKLEDGQKLEQLSAAERQELGIYQARVVLMVLAAELALKFLWEQVQEDQTEAAGKEHNLPRWFNDLPLPIQAEIQTEYCKRVTSPPNGWETPDKIFELCKDASVQWRYLVEKSNLPKYEMHAKFLKYATLSVLKIAKGLALKK